MNDKQFTLLTAYILLVAGMVLSVWYMDTVGVLYCVSLILLISWYVTRKKHD